MKVFGKNINKNSLRNQLFNFKQSFQILSSRKLLKSMKDDVDYPSSAGSTKQHIELTLTGSISTPKLLLEATKLENIDAPSLTLQNYLDFKKTPESEKLRNLFDFFGSDKGTEHNYDLVYSSLLQELPEDLTILEIGLGTNFKDVASNMGKSGSPGASLRAWREFRPLSAIYGCDIDSRILFEEERIQTFQLDQTSNSSWDKFKEQVRIPNFNLIIDDGLHSPTANLTTLINSWPILEKEGVLVIEDVAERSLPIWEILQSSLNLSIIKLPKAYMVIVRKGKTR